MLGRVENLRYGQLGSALLVRANDIPRSKPEIYSEFKSPDRFRREPCTEPHSRHTFEAGAGARAQDAVRCPRAESRLCFFARKDGLGSDLSVWMCGCHAESHDASTDMHFGRQKRKNAE